MFVGDCDIGKVQGLGVVGGVYMTAVTASTVGFGDLTPQSPWGKLIAIFYAPVAVALLSKTVLAISMIPTEYRKLKLESYVLDQFGDSVATSDLEQLRQLVNLKEGEECVCSVSGGTYSIDYNDPYPSSNWQASGLSP